MHSSYHSRCKTKQNNKKRGEKKKQNNELPKFIIYVFWNRGGNESVSICVYHGLKICGIASRIKIHRKAIWPLNIYGEGGLVAARNKKRRSRAKVKSNFIRYKFGKRIPVYFHSSEVYNENERIAAVVSIKSKNVRCAALRFFARRWEF